MTLSNFDNCKTSQPRPVRSQGLSTPRERVNPHEPEPGPFITMGEVALRNCPQWVRYEMETLHDRVMRVRDREPGEAPLEWPDPLRWILGRFRRGS